MSSAVIPTISITDAANQWRDAVGQPGYQVNAVGDVRSCRRGDWRLLKPGLAGNGYFTVALNDGESICIHRLVAEAFIENPDGRRTVNHKDGVKTNNVVGNLEWATFSENLIHARKMDRERLGGRQACSKLTLNDVLEIISLRGIGAEYKALAEAYNVSKSAICHILKGRTWRHAT